jgi:hypothetical protein
VVKGWHESVECLMSACVSKRAVCVCVCVCVPFVCERALCVCVCFFFLCEDMCYLNCLLCCLVCYAVLVYIEFLPKETSILLLVLRMAIKKY